MKATTLINNLLIYTAGSLMLAACSISKPNLPTVSLSPVAAAQEADEQCTTYGLRTATRRYISCVNQATDRILYNNSVAICGQKSFSSQCSSGLMTEINPTPQQSLEMSECKQNMYNLCVQSAGQEYLHHDMERNTLW